MNKWLVGLLATFVYLVMVGATTQSYLQDWGNERYYFSVYFPRNQIALRRDAIGVGFIWPVYWPIKIGQVLAKG